MSQQTNTGLSNLNGTVSQALAIPATGQTLKQGSVVSNTATGFTVYTVTAGKTFYCTGLSVGCGSTLNGYFVADGANKCIFMLSAQTSMSMGGGILFSASGGSNITVTHNGAGAHCQASVWGYEV
jgi:hypothetical protein